MLKKIINEIKSIFPNLNFNRIITKNDLIKVIKRQRNIKEIEIYHDEKSPDVYIIKTNKPIRDKLKQFISNNVSWLISLKYELLK